MIYDFASLAEGAELGTQRAHRLWRYTVDPILPTELLSWTSNTLWPPGAEVEGANPDIGEQGIHGFKTAADMWESFDHKPEWLLLRAELTGCGVIFGQVDLYGIIWDHEKGYRAQFARPASFDSAIGDRCDEALAALRASFQFDRNQ